MMPPSGDLSSSAIVLKIENGTVTGSGNLCKTCTSSQVMRGVGNQERIFCHRLGGTEPYPVPFPVAQCNRYVNANHPPLYAMEEIAWRLVTSPSKKIGFVDPAEFRRRAAKDEQ